MFHGWENFYVMLGSAAGSLIGLMFVVVTLTAGLDRAMASRGQDLYMTPTIASFGIILAVSAATLAPGVPRLTLSVIVAVGALAGMAAALRAMAGIMRPRPSGIQPHWSDAWLYGACPAFVFAALIGAAAGLAASAGWSAYALAALLVILLLVCIRNAWDLITAIAPARRNNPGGP